LKSVCTCRRSYSNRKLFDTTSIFADCLPYSPCYYIRSIPEYSRVFQRTPPATEIPPAEKILCRLETSLQLGTSHLTHHNTHQFEIKRSESTIQQSAPTIHLPESPANARLHLVAANEQVTDENLDRCVEELSGRPSGYNTYIY